MRGFRVASRLGAEAEAVWAVVSTLDGINAELAPVLRMTRPAGVSAIREGRLGRSWLLLGGFLPVDYDDLVVARLDPGRGFRERSALASAPEWHHDRTLEPLPGGGCRVVDEVRFRSRLPAAGGLHVAVVATLFRHRHRRLRRRFGSVS